jgi:hypothetical protein
VKEREGRPTGVADLSAVVVPRYRRDARRGWRKVGTTMSSPTGDAERRSRAREDGVTVWDWREPSLLLIEDDPVDALLWRNWSATAR